MTVRAARSAHPSAPGIGAGAHDRAARRLRLVAALAGMCSLLTLPTAAASAAPDACNGLAGSDAKDDQSIVWGINQELLEDPPADTPAPLRAGANTDLLAIFFRVDDGRATANIRVAELTSMLPPYATAIEYEVFYGRASSRFERYLRIRLGGSEAPTSEHGQVTGDGAPRSPDGESEVALFEQDGIVQVELPPEQGGWAGTEIFVMWVKSAYRNAPSTGIPGVQFAQTFATDLMAGSGGHVVAPCPGSSPQPPDADGDGVPDDADRCPAQPASTPDGCPADTGGGGPAPPDGGSDSPAGGPTAPGGPSAPDGPTNPAGAAPGAPQPVGSPASSLRITVRPTIRSARAVALKRALSLRLTAREALTNLRAELLRGTAVLGRARLQRLSGAASLRLPIRRRLKQGRYTLRLTAARTGGAIGRLDVPMLIRR